MKLFFFSKISENTPLVFIPLLQIIIGISWISKYFNCSTTSNTAREDTTIKINLITCYFPDIVECLNIYRN